MESAHRASVVVTAADGTPELSPGASRRPGLPAVVEQAAPGPRDGAQRPRPRRPSCWPWPAPATPARTFHLEGVRRHPGRRRPDRGRPAEHPRPALRRRRAATAGSPQGRARPLAGAELLRQARRDAGHLRRSTAGTSATYRDAGAPAAAAMADDPRAELAGEPVAATAVDGCGAPVMAISLAGLARAFGRLAAAAPGTHEAPVADAIRSPPGVPRRHPPRRHRPDPGHARAWSPRTAPRPCTPSGWPTGAASP